MTDARAPRISLWLALALPLAFSMAWRASVLTEPPNGEHAWRDATGIGVARGFLLEGATLLEPRVAERMNGTGVAGMELPLVPWLSARLMQLFGESYLAARLPVWLSLIPLGLAALALARRLLGDETSARIAAACVVLQPLVLIFSHKLMPEIPMLALLLAGAAWSIDGLRGSLAKSLLGGSLLALAAVLKPTGVAVAFPLLATALTVWRTSTRRLGLTMRALVIAALAVAATAAWFFHARALDDATGFNPIKLQQDWLEWTHLLFQPAFLGTVFGRIFSLYLQWPVWAWMLVRWPNAIQVLRDLPALSAWMIASMAVVILFGSQNLHHTYYGLPAALPFNLWAGAFIARYSEWVPQPRRLLALFVLVFAIVSARRSRRSLPPLPYDDARVTAALAHVPEEEPALVTDEQTPVVSLIRLHRVGWAVPASSITPALLSSVHQQGARQVIESSFGGWLSTEARAALPAPSYADDQVRIYRWPR